MSVGQNPPFYQVASYYLSTSSGANTEAINAQGASVAIITNASPATLYVVFSNSTGGTSATVGNGYAVSPNSQRALQMSATYTWVSCILDSSNTGNAYIELGHGSAR